MRIAAVDIGTNSSRLLVADVEGEKIDECFRRSIVTRLGDKLDRTGRLDPAARDRVSAAIERYRDQWTEAGAERVAGIATSAMREAEDGAEFAAELSERFGLRLCVVDGDREAQLTYAGACTSGMVENGRPTVVVDIGGGSTEFIIGHEGRLDFHVSTLVGAVRHSERHLSSDPPGAAQVDELIAAVTAEIERSVPAASRSAVAHGIGVAGTPTVLASVDQELERFDPWKVHGYTISEAACERQLRRLAEMPLEQRREVKGLHPDRAPTIVAGAAIMLAAMRSFGLGEIVVSEHDLLYGIALELAAR